jgi:hypothetical protein
MMKKSISLILFSLFSISLFASGHGLNGLAVLFEFLVAVLIYGALFSLLTILTGINSSKPGKIRSVVYTIIFSIFAAIFIFIFVIIANVASTMDNAGIAAGGISPMYIFAGAFFALLFTLNTIFLVRAFSKLKKQKNP